LSDDAEHYHEVVAAIQSRLGALCRSGCLRSPVIDTVLQKDFASERARSFDLLVPLGRAAGLAVVRAMPQAPSIYALIPEATWREIEACCAPDPRRTTAVFLDQPVFRHLDLIRLALPDHDHVGILSGPTSRSLLADAEDEAAVRDLRVITKALDAGDPIGPALRDLLPGVQVMLALPDPMIYNRETIVSILLTTYRDRVPLVGYSRAMVKAGAVLALFSSPQDIGRQLGELAQAVWLQRPLIGPAPARYFRVAANRNVAQSLKLTLPDETRLTEQLGGQDR
jgi:ABC-type uncharacterized transport system substrate-binding protein